MAYIPFGWQNAPEGWTPGEPAPEGSENAAQTAERMEAFGAHVAAQSVGGSQIVVTAPGDAPPDPADYAAGALWIART
jgi:hypothetical protein